MSSESRRKFVKKAAWTAGLAAAPAVRPLWGQKKGPNDRINVAVVGIRGRGRAHYSEYAKMPNVRVTHLCDVDERLFGPGVAEVEKIGGYRPETVVDFRKLIEIKDIDAVSIATPDNWHALQTIWGCQAGKDVYCEKPACMTIREGRHMVRAAWKYGRMVQIGTQRRSDPRAAAAVQFMQSGQFGHLYRAKALVLRGRKSIGHVQESSIPKGVHWDLYRGPAPYTSFSLNKFHYAWHYSWDTATGEIGNNGVHQLDLIRWALDKQVHPVQVYCTGGKFEDDSDQKTPNVAVASYRWADGTMLDLEMTTLYSPAFDGLRVGSVFYTTEGYLLDTDKWKVVEGEFTARDTPDLPGGVSLRAVNLSFPDINYKPGPAIPDLAEPMRNHFENFIDCVRSRKREDLHCEVFQGHMSATLCHLANISLRLGRQVNFDPATESFPEDKEADKYLTRKYREPYVLPEPV